MEGEVLNNDFVASLPLISKELSEIPQPNVVHQAVYSPTLLREFADINAPFTGRLLFKNGDDIEINYKPLNEDDEILLGGICCTSDNWSQIDGCLQSANNNDILKSEPKLSILPPLYTSSPDESQTCSVCRWLNAGPCQDEYTRWDLAMKKFMEDENNVQNKNRFMDTAKTMSECVRKYEYYDIYVAFL